MKSDVSIGGTEGVGGGGGLSVSREAGGFEICKEASWGGDEPINPLYSDFSVTRISFRDELYNFREYFTRFEDSCDRESIRRNVDERSLDSKIRKEFSDPPLSVEKLYQVAGEKIIVFGYNISIQTVK